MHITINNRVFRFTEASLKALNHVLSLDDTVPVKEKWDGHTYTYEDDPAAPRTLVVVSTTEWRKS